MRIFFVIILIPGLLLPSEMIWAQEESTTTQKTSEPSAVNQSDTALSQTDFPERSYLFIHDTSLNMRRKRRIPLMQTSIRAVLDNLPLTSRTGMRAFGHRFSVDGPDACNDTDIAVALDPLDINREDFEIQLNLLQSPLIGGGSPVGLALQQGIADLAPIQGQKDIFLYLVDLQRCPGDKAIEAISATCEVDDLHLTLVGIGLKRDLIALQRANVEQLECVDIINIRTPEEAESLPDKLLTRFSVEFRNAEGRRVDPAPGGNLLLKLFRENERGKREMVREKTKNLETKGSSIETVGLDEGTYFMDLFYQGQKLRSQKTIVIKAKDELHEVVHLGKMLVSVTDSEGNLIGDPKERELKITLTDAGKIIRNVEHTSQAAFDLLPGNKYKVLVSYAVGGAVQSFEYETAVTINAGNHKNVSIQLPIGAVSGKVIDMSGNPVKDIDVILRLLDQTGEPSQQESTVVLDDQGRYFFPDVKTGNYELSFSKQGYKPESIEIPVIGGKINTLAALKLFRGLAVIVYSVSGAPIHDAEVSILHKASSKKIAIDQNNNIYRNALEIPTGEYTISIRHENFQADSKDVLLQEDSAYVEVPVELPYFVTVSGTLVNGKGEALPDATIEFQSLKASPVPGSSTPLTGDSEEQTLIKSGVDGTFRAILTVSKKGAEHAQIRWLDRYNQLYAKDVTVPLPPQLQIINLGKILLPVNFLRLTITDVIGNKMTADTVALYHDQSGQSGRLKNPQKDGIYESIALLDGDYTVRLIKRGYQEVEQTFHVEGGRIHKLPVTLHNYITVAGTVTDGKNNRVPGATITFQEQNSRQTSLQPIVTGKDGRFQATLLVKKAAQEQLEVKWKSSESGREYKVPIIFELQGIPITEYQPMNLGNYQIPANFVRVEVHDVSGKGLPDAGVSLISSHGKITRAVEIGDGIYESLDLYDGYYNITIAKPGYKENVVISDVAVGKGQREVSVGPIILPHYATVTGTVLNGNDEGVPNVEIVFGGKASEQLARCRTNQQGQFSTTVLVTSSVQEQWQAIWKREEYSVSGGFALPIHPESSANIGEIRLPANFVSIPVEDIQGNMLSEVNIAITDRDGTPVNLEEMIIEEIEAGMYRILNLPDGSYTLLLHKDNYEQDKPIEITVQGGRRYFLDPMQLGYYVTVTGTAVNGKREPLPEAAITFQGLHSRIVKAEELEGTPESAAIPETDGAGAATQISPAIVTNQRGMFSVTLLVTSPGNEQIIVTWDEQYSSSYLVNLAGGPGMRDVLMQLPINFIQVHLTDVSQARLSKVSVTVTQQMEKTIFPLQEIDSGTYESPGLPDGNYVIAVEKDQYASQTGTMSVKGGELKQKSFRLNHYVTIKGSVINGKAEGLSAATVTFENLKSTAREKAISGTDGAFETRLLVRETGKESGKISWVGDRETYTKQFWIDLPLKPGSITLSQEDTRLPINFISLEVKSVAATGISGASVTLTHRETGQKLAARDNENGNYKTFELSNGLYDILVTKDGYQSVKLENITVANGEHKSDLLIPKFSHYITISGIVLNGKEQGVSEARVAVKEPKRLQKCEPFTTREDGSFTLQALVTDVGSETIEVIWNEMYATTIPVQLPSIPEHIRVEPIKLPINFIVVTVRDVYGDHVSEAAISFVSKERSTRSEPQSLPNHHAFGSYTGRQVSPGIYESPDLPNNEYILIVRKEGYIQNSYPEIYVEEGVTDSNTVITLPHIVTVKGRVINGRGDGVPDVKVVFEGRNSRTSSSEVNTDEEGNFIEKLQVIGTGNESITLVKSGLSDRPEERFEISQGFALPGNPDIYEFEQLRLPMNFIPIRIQDVSGHEIRDVDISLTPVDKEKEGAATSIRYNGTSFNNGSPNKLNIITLQDGRYECQNLKDGAYSISVAKKGYQPQEQIVSVASGEIAQEVVFTLPHYVVVNGVVVEGKGNGVSDALLEFDSQNSELIRPERFSEDSENLSDLQTSIKTDLNGRFKARVLVKKVGIQQVRTSWNTKFVKQLVFTLPESPDMNYTLPEPIRLPINFVPFHITNVLGQGLAGTEITLSKSSGTEDVSLRAYALGGGYYEAQELPNGVYAMTIHKDGYQETTGNLSVNGGEHMPEQQFSLPHYVAVQGTVINDKGLGVANANITLVGLNSRLLDQEKAIVTAEDGSFRMELLITGSEANDLQEHIEVSWMPPTQSSIDNQQSTIRTAIPFGISHDFYLPATPGSKNLGLLRLPANFFPVMVQDISGKGLSGVTVQFIDENDREFTAREFTGGFYEGHNLPNGTYTIQVSKGGYREAFQNGIAIATKETFSEASSSRLPLTFQLPYYVDIKGVTVNGKGEKLTNGISLELAEAHSQIIPGTVRFDQQGNFKATLLVSETGTEQLRITWAGKHGLHALDLPIFLPEAPQTINLHRASLPVNFIPIEVKDLLGYGIPEAIVTLHHLETEKEMNAVELGNGGYEGQHLLDGTYNLSVSKEGYKPEKNTLITVNKGMVSPIASFRLQHYVWITGGIINGEKEGVRDPLIELEGLHSRKISEHVDITGRFEVQLEVQEVGSERMYFSWKNAYRSSDFFTLPGQPERKDLGEIRLPINFLSVLVTDISGSTLKDIQVTVEESSGIKEEFKTDQNGFCKTDDLPNGTYHVSVNKEGYRMETRDVQVRDGNVIPMRFTLPHYIVVRGRVRDIKQRAVSAADVIFEEFTDANGQKLRTVTDPDTGAFEQQLLIHDVVFLERQKGHFRIKKGDLEQYFTFKISTEPNHVVNYKTLLFPTTYLQGKVVDADVHTVPLDNAKIFLIPVSVPSTSSGEDSGQAENQLLLTTNSLGAFEFDDLKKGEYKITIQKEGYDTYEDFIHISGLLHEQEFILRKK